MNTNLKVMLSGPMSGYADYNKPAFYAVEKLLRSIGFTKIVNPASFTIDFECSEEEIWKQGIRQSIKALADCDAILYLEGHEKSRGAQIEKYIAEKLGLENLNVSSW